MSIAHLTERESAAFALRDRTLEAETEKSWLKENFNITKIALKILALNAVAAVGITACISLSVVVLAGAFYIPVPIIVGAGVVGTVALYIALRTYNYDDRQNLEKERNALYGRFLTFKEMRRQDFEMEGRALTWLNREVLRTHGAENIFRYGVPRSHQLKEMVMFALETASFQDGYHLYRSLKEGYNKLDPSERFAFHFSDLETILKRRFAADFIDSHQNFTVTLEHFFKSIDFEKMQSAGVFTPVFANQLRHMEATFKAEKARFEERVGRGVVDSYKRDIAPHKYERDQKIHDRNAVYKRHPAHYQLSHLYSCLEQALEHHTGRREQKFCDLREERQRVLGALRAQHRALGIEGSARAETEYNARAQEYDRRQDALTAESNRELQRLSVGFKEQIDEKRAELRDAKARRDRTVDQAQAEYSRKVAFVERTYREVTRPYREDLERYRAQCTAAITRYLLD